MPLQPRRDVATRATPLVVVAVAALVAASGLLATSTWPWAFDWATHVFVAAQFQRGLGEGLVYPTWIEPADRGFGSPALLYYPPGPFFLSAALGLVAPGGVTGALKASVVLLFLVGGLGTYRLARRRLERPAATVAGAAWVLAPAHVAFLYGDWLYANLAGMALAPWLLWRAARPGQARVDVPLAAGFGLFALAHLPSPVVWFPWLAALGLALAGADRRTLGRCAASLALGAALAAVYVAPAVLDLGLIHVELFHDDGDVGTPAQNLLFTPAHPRGPGPWLDFNTRLGWANLVQLGAVALALAVGFRAWPPAFRAGLAALTALYGFLMFAPAAAIWEAVPRLGLAVAHLPWRLGAPLVLVFALAAGEVLAPAGSWPRAWRAALLGLLGTALLLTSLQVAAAPDEAVPAMELRAAEHFGRWPTPEYRPVGSPGGTSRRAPGPRFRVEPATARAQTLLWEAERRRILWESPTDGRLWVRTYWFPTWTSSGPPPELDPATGGLTFAMPAGRHELELRFGWTKARRAGAAVSALAALVMLALAAAPRLLRSQREVG